MLRAGLLRTRLLRADLLRSGAHLLCARAHLLCARADLLCRAGLLRTLLRSVLLQAAVPSFQGPGRLDQEPLPLELLQFVLRTGLLV